MRYQLSYQLQPTGGIGWALSEIRKAVQHGPGY
jgi:hypothetical protein